jgi:cytochrome c oxidase subunit I+III
VGHFHNVLFAGTLFGVFAGFYYWFPKMSGRFLSDRLGRVHFWTMIIGFTLTYFPMYALGLMGMPRRVYTYASNLGWNDLNFVSSIGGYVLAVSITVFVVNVVRSFRSGEVAGDDPWDAWTLEWATTSPPPPENFDSLPPIHSARPLWDLKHPEAPDEPDSPDAAVATVLEATGGGAEPHGLVSETEHATIVPLFVGIAILVMAIGLLSSLIVSLAGILLLFVVVGVWLSSPFPPPDAPADPTARFTIPGLGMLVFLGSEVVFFGSLIAAAVHLRIHTSTLGPFGLGLALPIVNTVVLISSGIAAHYALVGLRKGRRGWFSFLLVLTVILGAIFLGGQAWEYTHVGFGLSSGVEGSTFFTLTGFHGAHVTAGILVLLFLFVGIRRQWRLEATTGDGGTGMMEAGTYYWHFVDAVWVAVFVVVYLL